MLPFADEVDRLHLHLHCINSLYKLCGMECMFAMVFVQVHTPERWWACSCQPLGCVRDEM